jgi:hypothetical protein
MRASSNQIHKKFTRTSSSAEFPQKASSIGTSFAADSLAHFDTFRNFGDADGDSRLTQWPTQSDHTLVQFFKKSSTITRS